MSLEQLLYLPSLGACVLAGCLLRSGSTHRRDGTAPPDSGGETPQAESRESEVSTSAHSNDEGEESGEKGRGGRCPLRFSSRDGSPPAVWGETGSDRQERSRQPSGRKSAAPVSSTLLATRAPSCSSCIGAPQPTQANTAEKAAEPPRAPALRRSSHFSAKNPVVMVVLLSWAAYFGARTHRRCKDWYSESSLFESALNVCPDGIKTLNNVAVGMLNEKEAGHAQALLRRAVEVSFGGCRQDTSSNNRFQDLILLITLRQRV